MLGGTAISHEQLLTYGSNLVHCRLRSGKDGTNNHTADCKTRIKVIAEGEKVLGNILASDDNAVAIICVTKLLGVENLDVVYIDVP